ncbi:MAG: hypothetical protein SFV55_26565 [Haliscomenobacter sp.]|uniref:hypothetical protein n=1 Tax=Haliscomenobacter sp. TaxID=2717303 RepID=UPI0029A26517|nr:hypothetical protein [Haliscomenobacter sp.]MDX2072025.1 hypothetical protein [Haliscomenobacter sp.]
MKTLSILVVMLSVAFTTFAGVPEGKLFHSEESALFRKNSIELSNFAINPVPKECSVSMSATIMLGTVECVITVTATGATCADATTSAISQLGDAKKAIQEALQ